MSPLLKRVLGISAAFIAVHAVAAQTIDKAPDDGLQVEVRAPPPPVFEHVSLKQAERQAVKAALSAARRGDRATYDQAYGDIRDPVARKLVFWTLVDAQAEALDFAELDRAQHELAGWPRADKRRRAVEAALESANLSPAEVIAWFGPDKPSTAEGAMSLAGALQASGLAAEAQAVVREIWRTRPFGASAEGRMLARYAALLTSDDHAARADLLLYGDHDAALKAVVDLLSPDKAALAKARMALREDNPGPAAALPPAQQSDRGLVLERAAYLRRAGKVEQALELAPALPPAPASEDGEKRVWTERRQLIAAALKRQDYKAAYAAAGDHGFTERSNIADAEFYAGWLALAKLNNPGAADAHFARIASVSSAPITQARAFFWRGRAAEAQGQKEAAREFYGKGAQFYWTFYGQLAAEAAGQPIRLDPDPAVNDSDRHRFEALELVRAARILAEADEYALFRTLVMHLDDSLPQASDYVQLVDLARAYGDQDLSMHVVRSAAQKGHAMPGRGYPTREAPSGLTAETPLVLGITRQESGFDPKVRSPADARGLMQILPGTAEIVARRIGLPYAESRLYEPDYNMRLGGSYVGQLVDRFGGSYVMAVAGYNAGPGRLDEWTAYCGDPRQPGTDPLDFIECIPFSETRNYVMRVLEGAQVYRAKLGGGEIAPSLAEDLRRGTAMMAGGPPLQP